MSAPTNMTAETLNALKGWPSMAAVDFQAKLDPTIAVRVPAGSCVRLSSTLTFLLGVGNLFAMPMFTFQASDAADVSNSGGNPATVAGAWVPIAPVGYINALVAIGAYELVSTSFDTTANFVPNSPVTSPTTGANAGLLTLGVAGTNTICGVVSRGVVNNGYGTNALAFWPVFLPPAAQA